MPTVELLQTGYGWSSGLDKSDGRLTFIVRGLTVNDSDPNAALQALPYQPGQIHPQTGLPCVRTQIVRMLGPDRAVCVVYFDNIRWGSARSSLITESQSLPPIEFRRPVFVNETTVGPPYYRPIEDVQGFPDVVSRARVARFVNKALTLNDAQVNQILAQSGSVYTFGSVPYLFDGAQVVRSSGGQSRVRYRYISTGPVSAVSPSDYPSLSVVCPPSLGPLEEYRVNYAGGGLSITKRSVAELYAAGEPLP